MPFGDLFKLPEGFKQRRSAPNRMEGLTFPQKVNYMGQFEGPSLMALGAGISSGHPEKGFSDMAKIQSDYQANYAGEAEQDRLRQQTTQYLTQQGMDPQQAAAAAENPDILRHIFQLQEEQQRAKAQNETKVFGTPIYGTDTKTGKTGIGSFDSAGQFHVIETGDFEVASGIKTYDTPTEVITVNMRTGEIISREPKDVAGAAAQEERGKGKGQAQAAYDSMVAGMPGVEYVVTELESLANKATYTLTGQAVDAIIRQTGRVPREAAQARAEYINKVKMQVLPLLRDTFGAQFTKAEGDSLLATLGDPDASPVEKQATLKAFIEQKRRDVEAKARQIGEPSPGTPSPAPAGGGGGNSGITIQEVP